MVAQPDPKLTATASASTWSPFRHRAYATIWTATLVANIGAWMYSSSAAWLMTTLDPHPVMVSLVQVASSLPLFLFAIPAGALSDIVDKRRFLLAVECLFTAASIVFAAAVWLATPWTLLLFTFLIESCVAAASPGWQAVVPPLVPRRELGPAIAMNSVGVNISRAVGPALGGAMTATIGIAAPFWVNAVTNVGVIAALARWRPPAHEETELPAERFTVAMRTGLRHAAHNRYLLATLARSVGFFLFASCYWALLPLVARRLPAGSAGLYGALLGTIGLSAIASAFALPWLKTQLGPNRLAALGSVATALALALFAVAHNAAVALLASAFAGSSWITTIAILNVSAQVALPDWVRARGLAVYVTVFFGAMTLGSVLWGQVAGIAGVPAALSIACGGCLLAIAATWRWKLQTGAKLDLTPSMHWPTPPLLDEAFDDAGPVMVTLEYRVRPERRGEFLKAMQSLSQGRRRDGAYAWGIFEDVATPNRFIESFLIESWLEHLRQHERVTNADRVVEERILAFLTLPPQTTHWIAPVSGSRVGG